MKTFDELWKIVWGDVSLPIEAEKLIPQSLTENTKQKMLKTRRSTAKIARKIEQAVDEINHGSIESIDTLIRSALDR